MKKRILFIMPSLTGGGAEKVLVDILNHMDFQKYEVSLFLEFKSGVYLEHIPHDVKLVSFYSQHTKWHDRLFFLLRLFHLYVFFHSLVYRFLLRHLLKGDEFDTVISFMEGNALKLHSYILDKAKKHLSWVHIDLKKKHWSLEFFKNAHDELLCYEKMDKVIFVSEDARLQFLDLYPVADEKCMVIHNLIDRNEIMRMAEQQQVQKRKFTVCMLGRLNHQKRYDRALQVACRLKKEGYDIDFWILGDGELRTVLENRIRECGMEDSFLLLGFVKPPYAYLKMADVYWITSDSEGYSLAVCEALCLGRPVVATSVTGPKELLRLSNAGLLTGEDIDSIYYGLKRMIEEEELRKECSKNAFDYAAVFDVSATMQQIYKLI